MIDMHSESLMTLATAARSLPGRVHVSTVHRWRLRGVRGVKLETLLVGGIRYTSREAVQRFADRLTAESSGETPPTRTSRQRQRAIEAAERDLSEAGV